MTKLGQGWSAEDMDAMRLKVSAQFALLVLTHIQNLDQRQNNARIRKTEQKFFLPSQRMYWHNSSRADVNQEKWKCKKLDECPSGKVPINLSSSFLLGSKTFGWQFYQLLREVSTFIKIWKFYCLLSQLFNTTTLCEQLKNFKDVTFIIKPTLLTQSKWPFCIKTILTWLTWRYVWWKVGSY